MFRKWRTCGAESRKNIGVVSLPGEAQLAVVGQRGEGAARSEDDLWIGGGVAVGTGDGLWRWSTVERES